MDPEIKRLLTEARDDLKRVSGDGALYTLEERCVVDREEVSHMRELVREINHALWEAQ